jgi:hypothetical protein
LVGAVAVLINTGEMASGSRLFGRGDLLPVAALLGGQALVELSLVPRSRRGHLYWCTGFLAAATSLLCAAVYGQVASWNVPDAGKEGRVAVASLVVFLINSATGVVAVRLVTVSRQRTGRRT